SRRQSRVGSNGCTPPRSQRSLPPDPGPPPAAGWRSSQSHGIITSDFLCNASLDFDGARRLPSMAKRCPTCRAPLKEEIVFHRKIGLDNKPQLYHYVRRYTCPEGCTTRLDFSK